MKKLYYFLSVMLLTLVSVGFVSCGDDKDEPKSSDLVGTWQLKAIDEEPTTLRSTSMLSVVHIPFLVIGLP